MTVIARLEIINGTALVRIGEEQRYVTAGDFIEVNVPDGYALIKKGMNLHKGAHLQ